MALLGHDFAEGLAGQHGAENVEIEDPAESVGGQVEELEVGAGGGSGLVASRAVDEAVDLAELADHVLGSLGNAVAVEYVALVERDLLAMGAERVDERLGRLDVEVEDGNLSAATGQCAGHFAAENASAASDGDDKAGEVVHFREFCQIKGNMVRGFRCMVYCESSCHYGCPSQLEKSSTVVRPVSDCYHR